MEVQTPIPPAPPPLPLYYQINDEAERRAKTGHFSIFDFGGRGRGLGFPFIFSKIIVYTLASSTDNCYCNSYTDREESENEKRRKKWDMYTRSLPILHSFPKTEQ